MNTSRSTVRAVALLVGILVSGWWCVLTPAQAEPVKIRMGWISSETMEVLIAQKKDLLKHAGKSYTLEAIRFQGTSPQTQALAAKELEMATMSYTSFATAVLNAKLDVVIVADGLKSGFPGTHSDYWAVLESSPIKRIEDLRGKTIAVPARGTASDIVVQLALQKHGLHVGKDYLLTEVSFPNMEAFLRSGKIDVANFLPPFWAKANLQGGVRSLFRSDYQLGKSEFVFHAMRRDFVQAHRAQLLDFFEDYLRGWRWFLDPANREKALDVIVSVTKLPRAAYEGWALTKAGDYYRDPNALVNSSLLQSNIDLMHKMKFIDRSFEVKNHMDLSLIEEAARRLAKEGK